MRDPGIAALVSAFASGYRMLKEYDIPESEWLFLIGEMEEHLPEWVQLGLSAVAGICKVAPDG